MAGHGGQRVNSGRRPLRATQLAADLLAPIERGLELAGLMRGLAPGPALAAEVQARIVADHVLTGGGFEVLKLKAALLSAAGPAGSADEGEHTGLSPLIGALSRMPGMPEFGAESAPIEGDALPTPGGPGLDEGRATDHQFDVHVNGGSAQPLFHPQLILDLEPSPAPGAEPGVGAQAPGGAPTPPRGAAPAALHPHGENFETPAIPFVLPPLDTLNVFA